MAEALIPFQPVQPPVPPGDIIHSYEFAEGLEILRIYCYNTATLGRDKTLVVE